MTNPAVKFTALWLSVICTTAPHMQGFLGKLSMTTGARTMTSDDITWWWELLYYPENLKKKMFSCSSLLHHAVLTWKMGNIMGSIYYITRYHLLTSSQWNPNIPWLFVTQDLFLIKDTVNTFSMGLWWLGSEKLYINISLSFKQVLIF